MKKRRMKEILKIIANREISTQTELVNALREEGVEATQATLSRDIKELGLIKIGTSSGGQKYALSGHIGDSMVSRLREVFRTSVIDVREAENLIVVKTLAGMAQAAGSVVDSLSQEGVVGCIAGDDTLLVVARDKATARELVKTFSSF